MPFFWLAVGIVSTLAGAIVIIPRMPTLRDLDAATLRRLNK
jgi:hypothetical protein